MKLISAIRAAKGCNITPTGCGFANVMCNRGLRFAVISLLAIFISVSGGAQTVDDQKTDDTFLSRLSIHGGLSGNFPRDSFLFRKGGFEVGVGYIVFETSASSDHPLKISADASYLDFGQQPHDIRNINRVINLDVGVDLQMWPNVSSIVLVGLTDSDFGYNGDLPSEPGYSYKAHNGFSGQNAAIGLSYQATRNMSLLVKKGFYYFHQIDRADNDPRGSMEPNGNLMLGLKVSL
jgi:hypothetical protein